MSRRAITAVVAAVLAVSFAAVFWSSRQSGPERAESLALEPETASTAGPVAPEATQQPGGDKKEDWFPDLSDRNNIPGVNLGVSTERSSFGCDVDEIAENLGRNLGGEDSEARLTQYLNTLAYSGDAEHHLAAMQLQMAETLSANAAEDSPQLPEVDHLARALQADPMNPLVLWHAVGACTDPDVHSACTDPNVQSNMQSVLGGNGAYWAQVSVQRYVGGDPDGALDALRRAASAPTFDNYFMEHVRMHQRALSLIPDIGPVERALGGYALSMTTIGSSGRGLIPCLSSAEDPSWFDACAAVANRFASESPTIMQRAFGMEMLARVYDAGGQPEAAELERERASELIRSFWIENEDMIAVLATDERVLSLYLEELEASDEMNAVQFLGEEIERLKQDPTYSPCPPDEVGD